MFDIYVTNIIIFQLIFFLCKYALLNYFSVYFVSSIYYFSGLSKQSLIEIEHLVTNLERTLQLTFPSLAARLSGELQINISPEMKM